MKTGLDTLLGAINKQYGPGTILRAGEAKTLTVSRVPTYIPALDLALGGGLPRGRITVAKGEYSAGKSALAFKAAASFQRHCRYCATPIALPSIGGKWEHIGCECKRDAPMRVVWADAEHSYDSDWAARWGVRQEDIYVIQTEYSEQCIDVADRCIRSQECDFLVVDSVAALTPSVEIQESSEKWQMGVAARLMNKALRKWTSGLNSGGLLAQTQCTIYLINQMRMNISGYGSPVTSPGGKGIDFFESVELRLKRTKWIEDPLTKRPVAMETEFVTVKNKTAPAQRTGAYTLYFLDQPRRGYQVGDTDTDFQILRLAVFWGLVKKAGSWFHLDGEKFHGEERMAAALRGNPAKLAKLEAEVLIRESAWLKEGKADGAGEEEAKSEGASAEEA